MTLADVSDVALGRAKALARAEGLALTTVRVDLLTSPPPAGPWDLVLCTHFLHRPLFALLPGLLVPGGILVFSHATKKNLERHSRPGPNYLLDGGELASLVRGLEILQLEEAGPSRIGTKRGSWRGRRGHDPHRRSTLAAPQRRFW